jgi:6-phosphogluconate dehydrogenase
MLNCGAYSDTVCQHACLCACVFQPGDLIIDGGNEWYPNSVRRAAELTPRGLHFMGMGVSGGEEGARNGPSLMPGGAFHLPHQL